MISRNPVRSAGFALLAISAVAVLLGCLSFERVVALRAARAALRHTYAVIDAAGDLGIAIRDAERGQRGFLLTGKDAYLSPYDQGVKRIADLQGTLLQLTADNSTQQARVHALAPILQRKLDELAHTIEVGRRSGLQSAQPILDTDVGLRLMADIEERLDAIEAAEKRLLAPQAVTARGADDAIVWATVGGAGTLAVFIALSAWFLFWTQRVQLHHQAQARHLLEARAQAEAAVRDGEVKLRELVETLDLAAVLVRAMDGTVRFWSKGCEHLYGWTAQEIVGLRSENVLNVEYPVAPSDIESTLLRDGEWKGDLTHHRRDGTAITVSVHKALRCDAEGRPIAVMESVADVTALRQAQAALERLNQDLHTQVMAEVQAREAAQVRAAHAERMQALGQLAGGIAHDLNNVLQAVHGSAGLLEKSAHDAETVGRLSRLLLNAVNRGTAITGRLLAFSRRSELRPEALNAITLFSELRELLTPTLGPGLDIRIEASAALPLLFADKGQLETVLVNLATNARDAMAGSGILTLRASAETAASDQSFDFAGLLKAGSYVRLSIADTGHGMDAAMLARVTEPFFTTKAKGKGTGLGLAMAKDFAEQSNGLLHIKSMPGQGTAVSLWLPAEIAVGVPALAPSHDAPLVSAGTAARVLVVDDDDLVREIIASGLEDAGYDIARAASGQEALELLDGVNAIDLVLSDYNMPGMNGVTLIREVRQRMPDLAAILLTGYVDDAANCVAKDTTERGFDVLRKPIQIRALVARIEDTLAGVRLHRSTGSPSVRQRFREPTVANTVPLSVAE